MTVSEAVALSQTEGVRVPLGVPETVCDVVPENDLRREGVADEDPDLVGVAVEQSDITEDRDTESDGMAEPLVDSEPDDV